MELKKEQVYISLIKYKCATTSSKIYGHKIESFQSDDIIMSTCLCARLQTRSIQTDTGNERCWVDEADQPNQEHTGHVSESRNNQRAAEQQSSATGVTFDSTDELQRRSERAADLEEVHEDSKAPGVR